jgi:hypothetical protein
MTMTFPVTSSSEAALNPSLVALTLLDDPVSTLLDRGQLTAVAAIGFRNELHTTSRCDLRVLRDCARDLDWLRPKLKRAITAAFAAGDIDAVSTQRFVDRFQIWSD